MEWLNLHTSVLDSPEVVGEDPTNRATWLFLLRYCVGQENGGVIKNAAELGDRKWQQMVRVTLREVRRKSDLWTWVDGALIVHAYPIDKEQQVKDMRELGRSTSAAKKAAAKANGSKGGRPPKDPEINPTENLTGKPTKNPPKTHIREGKGREGNGREPRGFSSLPSTYDQAIAFTGAQMIPEPFIRETFDRCMAVGWIDTQQRPIASWPHYIAKSWADQQQREKANPSAAKPKFKPTFV